MTKGAKHHPHYQAKKSLQLRMAFAYLAVFATGGALMAAVLILRLRRALKLEMYRGHSTVDNTWDLLLPDVVTVSIVATAAVLFLTAGITLAMLATVQRSARRITRDLRSLRDGGDPAAWEPLRRPREFRHLQKLLVDGVGRHRRRLAEMDATCVEILERTRGAQAATAAHRDLRTLHVLCERLRNNAQSIRLE